MNIPNRFKKTIAAFMIATPLTLVACGSEATDDTVNESVSTEDGVNTPDSPELDEQSGEGSDVVVTDENGVETTINSNDIDGTAPAEPGAEGSASSSEGSAGNATGSGGGSQGNNGGGSNGSGSSAGSAGSRTSASGGSAGSGVAPTIANPLANAEIADPAPVQGNSAGWRESRQIRNLVSGTYEQTTVNGLTQYFLNNSCAAVRDSAGDTSGLEGLPDMSLSEMGIEMSLDSVEDIRVDGDNASATVTAISNGVSDTSTMRFVKEGRDWKFCSA